MITQLISMPLQLCIRDDDWYALNEDSIRDHFLNVIHNYIKANPDGVLVYNITTNTIRNTVFQQEEM